MRGVFAWYTLSDGMERSLYERIASSIREGRAVPIGDASPACVSKVFHAVLTDRPELFCVDGKWQLVEKDGQRYAMLHFPFTPQETAAGLRQLSQLSDSFAHLKTQPVPERILAVYDWLLSSVEYGFTETDGQSCYDALIRRRAVCKGIAKAFQYLMNSLDVFCTLAEGSLDGAGRHVWNVAEIDGAFYHVDVCMGYARFAGLFSSTGNARRCCLVGDETLKRTHQLAGPESPRLLCAADYRRKEACL